MVESAPQSREDGMAQLVNRRRSTPAASGDTAASIPDKLYFRIGEVARLCGLPAYVLRFWESEFPQLKPNKGGTGQRLYRRRDVLMVMRIKTLLYEGGFTIPGARQMLATEARRQEPQLTLAIVENDSAGRAERKALRTLRGEMQDLLAMLGGEVQAGSKKVQTMRPARAQASHAATITDLFES